ncbi:MAG: glycosyltransferase [Bryobacterales bacterium]|nr:glycosyltransferase [Bryobacterales bacterium]
MAEPIKLAFASGSDDLIPTLLDKMGGLYPDLPLHVISEFPPPPQYPWIRWFPAKTLADNTARIDAAVQGKQVVLAGIILQPRMPFWSMRWAAARRWPWQLIVFNENLDHFMLRPRSLPVIARHFYWRARNFVRWETRPGGTLYTFLWRLAHPWAFRRPLAYRLALWSGRLAPRPPAPLLEQTETLQQGITVVIPSRNGRPLLARLLQNIKLVPGTYFPAQWIVVDNGSTDGTADWLRREYPHIEVEHSEHPLSFAAAVNRGIRKARHSRTCLLNNDMVLEPNFFTELEKPFHSNPDLFAATAQIFFPEHTRREETGKAMYHRNNTGQFPLWCETPLDGEDGTWVLYGSGGCTLYDTAKLKSLGGIGEQYTPAYVEDLDIGWRAWRQGWPTVFAANAKLLHLHRSTTTRYFTPEDLANALERNYLQFAAGSNSQQIWREAIARVNLLAAKQVPEKPAENALKSAWLEPFRQPQAASGDDSPLALCSGAVAVFPCAPAAGKPTILIAAPYLPFPLSHGGAVRMFNLMREAAREFNQILLTFVDELAPPAPELKAICTEIILVRREGSHLLPSSPRPDVVEEHDRPEFRAALAATLQKWRPQIVQLEFTQMGLYAPACRPAKTILVEHDITLDLYNQLLQDKEDYDTRHQYEKWVRFENQAWRDVDAVVAMSAKDCQTITTPNAHAILNGVDLSRFTPSTVEPEPNRILFIGSFAHLPNVMALHFFLKDAWPMIRHKATLHVIAGQRHEYFLARYQDRVQLDLNDPNIQLDGFVSDVRQAYFQAAIIIAPLVASAGTNIKIMEAMAMRKAIVSTPAGINGLTLTHNKELLIASTGAEIAQAIERLIDNPSERKTLEAAARLAAEQNYGWDQIGLTQAALYRRLLSTEKIH